jgi:RNA polymerase sigma-70 factor (ECF subfamily)
MNAEQLEQHISQITTAWTVLFQAHASEGTSVDKAREQLLQRYSAPVYRYLLSAVRNADVADDLFQEFALRFVRGDFKRADPERGRFRDFLKRGLYHLVVDHYRRLQRQPQPLAPEQSEPAGGEPVELESEREFLAIWRAEVMNRTWQALEQVERESGQPLYTVLRCRIDHPELPSPEMAVRLAARLHRDVSPQWVRKWLARGREKFSDLLLREVERSLEHPTEESVSEELIDLGLSDYCQAALKRWVADTKKSAS